MKAEIEEIMSEARIQKLNADLCVQDGLKAIRDMSDVIEMNQDLAAYGDYLAYVKPFKSDKGERIGSP